MLQEVNGDTLTVELARVLTTLKPGDKLIFRVNRPIDPQEAARLREHVAQQLGPDVGFLIIDTSTELYVVRAKPAHSEVPLIA